MAINLETPDVKEKQEINAVPFVIANAVTRIVSKKQPLVAEKFKELGRSYVENNRISEEDLKILNDLTHYVLDVPLVKTSDKVAQYQIAYEEEGVKWPGRLLRRV
ncbi:MAG: hypothetical protein KKH29_02555 [Candidatus Omnitrophica bacterium]|nr:hypothetical protein [Candidatus Omnitrophota bacterium]